MSFTGSEWYDACSDRDMRKVLAFVRHLLTLRGRPHPTNPDELPRAVADAFGVDADGLDAPFAARRGPAPDEISARRRFGAYLDALDQLIRAVDADSPL